MPWRLANMVPDLKTEWWLYRQYTGERISFRTWLARREREDMERAQAVPAGIGFRAMQDAEAARRG